MPDIIQTHQTYYKRMSPLATCHKFPQYPCHVQWKCSKIISRILYIFCCSRSPSITTIICIAFIIIIPSSCTSPSFLFYSFPFAFTTLIIYFHIKSSIHTLFRTISFLNVSYKVSAIAITPCQEISINYYHSYKSSKFYIR